MLDNDDNQDLKSSIQQNVRTNKTNRSSLFSGSIFTRVRKLYSIKFISDGSYFLN